MNFHICAATPLPASRERSLMRWFWRESRTLLTLQESNVRHRLGFRRGSWVLDKVQR